MISEDDLDLRKIFKIIQRVAQLLFHLIKITLYQWNSFSNIIYCLDSSFIFNTYSYYRFFKLYINFLFDSWDVTKESKYFEWKRSHFYVNNFKNFLLRIINYNLGILFFAEIKKIKLKFIDTFCIQSLYKSIEPNFH